MPSEASADQHIKLLAKLALEMLDVGVAVVLHRLIVLAGVVHQHVKGAASQEELVGGVVDLLAAKIPHVEAKAPAIGLREIVVIPATETRGNRTD